MIDEIFKDLYLGNEYAYLRPYICKGNPYKAKVFLVGINPATPITSQELNIKEYIETIKDYDKFMKLYIESRKKQNKKEISRTRMGINSLVNWIDKECGTNVVETDIFTYPTENAKELIKTDNEILKRSKEKFWQVLMEFKPNTIILYGSLTIETFKQLVLQKKQSIKYFNKGKEKVEDLEKLSPYAKINIESKEVDILASRHFMYYGKTGSSFEELRKNIKKSIKKH